MSRPRWGSRAPCASKWVNRWGRHGDLRLVDRSSVPRRSPNATPVWIELVEGWRTEKKWSGQRISHVLAELGFASSSAQFRNVSGSYPTRHRVAAAGAPLRLLWLGQPFSIRRTARSWNSWSYLLGAEMALSLLCHLLCQISTLRDSRAVQATSPGSSARRADTKRPSRSDSATTTRPSATNRSWPRKSLTLAIPLCGRPLDVIAVEHRPQLLSPPRRRRPQTANNAGSTPASPTSSPHTASGARDLFDASVPRIPEGFGSRAQATRRGP